MKQTSTAGTRLNYIKSTAFHRYNYRSFTEGGQKDGS